MAVSSRYRCNSCDLVFAADAAHPRCPQCMRQTGLEAADPGPMARRVRPSGRLLLAIVLGASLCAGLVGTGLLLYRRAADLPRRGEIALLDHATLRATLAARGVPEALRLSPFGADPALARLSGGAKGVGAKGGDAVASARAVAKRLAAQLSRTRARLTTIGRRPPRLPPVLARELAAGKAGRVFSLELALLLTAALRDAGLTALVAEAHELDAPLPVADASGIFGRYLVGVYRSGGLGKQPLLLLDPLRAAALPAWAGGQQPAMKALARAPVPLDDASVVGHLLSLRALVDSAAGRDAQAYERSRVALEASAPSATLRAARARVLAASGGTADAIAQARKAVALRADAPRRQVLARMLLAAGDVQAARAALERAAGQTPSYWPAQLALAMMQRAAGDRAQADASLAKAVEIAADEPAVELARAERLLADDKRDEALALLRTAAAAEPSERVLLALYLALHAKGDHADEAAKVRERLLKVARDRAAIERLLGTP